MQGRQKCRILKEIRQRIADENDIPYVTRECHFQGACRGTCPRCESELRYLEQQLARRAAMGKRVAVAALCAGMAFTAAGCGPRGQQGGASGTEQELSGMLPYEGSEPTEEPEVVIETGEVYYPEDERCPSDEGLPPEEGLPPYAPELSGAVAWPEESENG
ncbi:MAG: hypothetical protein IJ594_03225 [Oscillospiraceae bacterium]|nr:hypothetical protein [Oscillospiraceae bacterium]